MDSLLTHFWKDVTRDVQEGLLNLCTVSDNLCSHMCIVLAERPILTRRGSCDGDNNVF